MKTTLKVLVVLIIVVGLFLVFFVRKPAGWTPAETIEWSVSFSKFFAERSELDWQEVYIAILEELKPRHLRIAVYWQDIETKKGEYDFSAYDWMIEKAQENETELVFVLGQKVPRWPECHLPEWARDVPASEREQKLLAFEKEFVERYKDKEIIALWQVENEPFLPFGECEGFDKKLVDQEISLIKELDPARQIILTDSGELSIWLQAYKRADIFGTTMYRIVWSDRFNRHIKYPLPPQFFWVKANIARLIYGEKPIIVSELQLEPWSHKQSYEISVEEQEKSLDLDKFQKNIEYAKKAGFPEVYLWGAEWWFFKKEKHQDDRYWEAAKAVMNP